MASNDDSSPTPFHMQDEGNTSGPLSGTEDSQVQTISDDATPPKGVARVDIGSIQTNPKISYGTYKALGKGLASSARLTEDGQIVVSLDLKKKLPELPPDHAVPIKEFAIDEVSSSQAPPMNIVIMIVGSRGDVQPYIVLGDVLKKHGHRVRIATHETFRQMVKDAGLEFYPIGGDPTELMSYMVRNPGLLPGTESLLNGDIPRKRQMLSEIIEGCWKACILPDEDSADPFAADAIISNPPAFAHVHCAEALGIPLHLSFTMPWCATTAFPHPLVRIKSSNAEGGLTNYLSYALADLIQWQGIGDIINQFRCKTLGLDALSLRSGSSVVDRLRIPWTYCFSPTLIPKPKDWMNHIDVVGFYFLGAAKSFKPEAELAEFLEAGSPPIYIGFGSVVVEDAAAMTQIIFDAVKLAKVRAIISAGWGGLGGKVVPQDVFILTSSVPHDWLFTKVSAVCHHGGAGTTAIGLLLGKPTIVVPFFGDQPFWGTMIHKAGAGPEPIPQKELKASTLADAIKYCLTEKAKSAAEFIAGQIKAENGPKGGVDSFHGHLPLLNMRCELDPKRVAVWWSQEYCLRLSAFAAQILVDAKRVKFEGLMPHRSKEFDTRKKVQDPITGGLSAIFWTITNYHLGIAQIFYKKDGIISATTAIPFGIAKIVDSVQEGFHNAPAMYGSNVRKVGKISDWKSGFMEGGKGFFYGYYDAITGLVTEPIRGHKQEGMLGALKGSARGILNTTMRPAAGALALVTHPARGIWESIRSNWAKHPELQVEIARRWEGQEAVKNCPNLEAERSAVVKAFEAAKEKTAERKDEYKRQAALFLQEGGGSSLENAPTLTAEAAGSTSATDDPPPRRTPPPLPSRQGALQARQGGPSTNMPQEYDQAVFQRDMEEAIRLSLAELEAQKNSRSADEENPAKVSEGQKPNHS